MKFKRLQDSIKKTKTDLPDSLVQELNHQEKNDARYKKISVKKSNRKLDRKTKRLEKKQKRRLHFSNQKNIIEESKIIPMKQMTKKEPIKKEKSSNEKQLTQLEKLEASNPHFYKMLVESRLIESLPGKEASHLGSDDVEEYAKLLKLKKGRITKAFEKDGLDELLEDLKDQESETFSQVSHEDMVLQPSNAGEEMDEMSLNESDTEMMDSEASLEEESMSGSENASELDMELSDESESDQELLQEEEPEPENAPKKYVPPHLRGQQQGNERLIRQIKGLINRLSDANMESILAELDDISRQHSRHGISQIYRSLLDVTDTLTNIILQMVGDSAQLIDSFVQTYAAFTACIYHIIGLDFGSHLVQKCVEILDKDHPNAKTRGNLMTLLGYLYSFGVLTCVIIYDYVRLCIQRLEEEDVEVLLRLLKSEFIVFQLMT
jgi:nucleolar MIF4G domain-containing protein 1